MLSGTWKVCALMTIQHATYKGHDAKPVLLKIYKIFFLAKGVDHGFASAVRVKTYSKYRLYRAAGTFSLVLPKKSAFHIQPSKM
jgi:hypothetical protein